MSSKPNEHAYLIAWVDTWLETSPSSNLLEWRRLFGIALENWDLSLAANLLSELRRRDLGVVGKAHSRLGQAGLLLKRDEWQKARRELILADKFFSQSNDPVGWTWVLLSLGNLYSDQSEWSKAITTYQKAIDLYRRRNDRYGEAQVLVNMGTAYYAQSLWVEATAVYQESLDIFVEVGDSLSAAMSLGGLGDILTDLGNYDEAVECYEACLEIFTEASNIGGRISTLNNLGRVWDSAGNTECAIEYYERSIRLGQEYGDLHGQAIALDNLGVSLNLIKSYDEAVHAHEQALEIFRSLGDLANTGASLNHLGTVCRNLGDYGQSETYFQESIAIKKSLQDQRGLASVMVNLALLYVIQDKWNEVEQIALEIQSSDSFKQYDEPLATSEYLLGWCNAKNNDLESAQKRFSRALVQSWMFNPAFGQRISRAIMNVILSIEKQKGILTARDFGAQIKAAIKPAFFDEYPDSMADLDAFLSQNNA